MAAKEQQWVMDMSRSSGYKGSSGHKGRDLLHWNLAVWQEPVDVQAVFEALQPSTIPSPAYHVHAKAAGLATARGYCAQQATERLAHHESCNAGVHINIHLLIEKPGAQVCTLCKSQDHKDHNLNT
jgi:hypothetical protein